MNRWTALICCVAIAALGGTLLVWAEGVLFWPALGAALMAPLGLACAALAPRLLPRLAALLFSLTVVFTAAEAVLWRLEARAAAAAHDAPATPASPALAGLPPEIQARIARMNRAWIMPRSWERRKLPPVPGRDTSFYWHEVLHVVDENNMRKDGPFPAKEPGRARIVVVGDSFTYGEGVAVEWAYPAQLERLLARYHPVEVLNLGVRGHQSEDVLAELRRFLPELRPDLVLYGVCLNDFLESGGKTQPSHTFPLPHKFKKFAKRRSRLGRVLEERYATLLRKAGLKPDFYASILEDFESKSARFARDVAEMNSLVRAQGLPPVLTMVLTARPRPEPPASALVSLAEDHLRAAGMQLIPSAAYAESLAGRRVWVSRWEQHPNEEAHAIFASLFAAEVLRGGSLATR